MHWGVVVVALACRLPWIMGGGSDIVVVVVEPWKAACGRKATPHAHGPRTPMEEL